MNKMYLLGHEESVKAHEMFMGRLKRDERLMNIIKKNNVDIDDILYLPTDDGREHKIVAITKSLAKYLFNNGHYELFDIQCDVMEHTVRDEHNRIAGFNLHVDCYLHYDVNVVKPPLMNIDDKVKFEYGFRFDDEENDVTNTHRRLVTHAEFAVVSLSELVSYIFAIMHKLLDENER